MKLIFSTFLELMVVANLGKNLRPSMPQWSMVSDSFAFTKAKSCKQHAVLVQ